MSVRAPVGVRENTQVISLGKLDEGSVVGDVVIMGFSRKQRLPYDTLRAIYLNAGLEENQLPRRRAAVDAFRLATSMLKDQSISTHDHGVLRLLVRDWKGGRTPRKDITLEKQSSVNDRFEYTSPAVCIHYIPEREDLIWDNRLNSETEWGAYHKLEALMLEVHQEFLRRRNLVDGDAIYASLQQIIELTAPLPLGIGSFLIWKEHKGVVHALKSVITALNEFNDGKIDEQSSVNIFSVVNTPEERETLSSALDQTIAHEVHQSIERMSRNMRTPENLIQSQGQLELDNYAKLKKLADEYYLRFRQENTRIEAQLDRLWKQQEKLMIAVANNEARKYREKLEKRREDAGL